MPGLRVTPCVRSMHIPLEHTWFSLPFLNNACHEHVAQCLPYAIKFRCHARACAPAVSMPRQVGGESLKKAFHTRILCESETHTLITLQQNALLCTKGFVEAFAAPPGSRTLKLRNTINHRASTDSVSGYLTT